MSYLKSIYPLENLDLKNLTLKLAFQIALTTAQRVQTLITMNINNVSDHSEYVVFTISDLQKTSRPVHDMQKVKISSFSDKSCCVLHTLRFYLEKTKETRKTNKILVSYKTFKEVSTSTVARWLKEILKKLVLMRKCFHLNLTEVLIRQQLLRAVYNLKIFWKLQIGQTLKLFIHFTGES